MVAHGLPGDAARLAGFASARRGDAPRGTRRETRNAFQQAVLTLIAPRGRRTDEPAERRFGAGHRMSACSWRSRRGVRTSRSGIKSGARWCRTGMPGWLVKAPSWASLQVEAWVADVGSSHNPSAVGSSPTAPHDRHHPPHMIMCASSVDTARWALGGEL